MSGAAVPAVIEHSNRGHAKYGMSSMYRWKRCAAAVRLAQYSRPRPSSAAAIRGTLLHEYQNYFVLTELLGFAGKLMPPSQPITEEEREAIQMIIDYVRAIMDAHPDIQVLTEQYAPFPQNVIPQEDCGGTVDIILYSQTAQTAWVLDSKFGRVYVNQIENDQGLGYATSGLWHVPVRDIVIIIAQPFSPGPDGKLIREWRITSDYLLEFQSEVEAALRRAEEPNGAANAGPWCTYCAAELICPARQAVLTAEMGSDFAHVVPLDGPVEKVMREMPDDQLGRLMAVDKAARNYLDAARREATLRATQGRPIPGQKLVEAQAKSAWKVDKKKPDEVRRLGARLAEIVMSAVDEGYSHAYWDSLVEKFIVVTTPNLGDTKETIREEIRKKIEARTELTKTQKNEIVAHAVRQAEMLAEKKFTGEPVLVPFDSHREEWNPTRKAFGHIKKLQ
jgi:hypothetical protein